MITKTIKPSSVGLPEKSLLEDTAYAKRLTQEWYIDRLLMSHFGPGSRDKYGYPSPSPKYLQWKKKYFPLGDTLILSGKLKKLVKTTAQTTKNGSIKVTLPEYGLFLIELGYDFLSPNSSDERELVKVYRRFLRQIRQKRAATIP